MPTGTGFAFGAVQAVDHKRRLAIVLLQSGAVGSMTFDALDGAQATLARMSKEVTS